ncbi:hypothetical protein BHM03_00018482 [Ensete ventricosum]|nr:hypothetical protein BHM03_00018482 [Ensete ventricosum]
MEGGKGRRPKRWHLKDEERTVVRTFAVFGVQEIIHPPTSSNLHHHASQSQPTRPAATGVGVGAGRPGNPLEVEMAQKDALMVCNPDFKRPFASVEDAVLRYAPF